MARLVKTATFIGLLTLMLGLLALVTPPPQISAQDPATLTPTAIPLAPTGSGAAWTGLFFSNPNFTGTPAIAEYPNGLIQNWGTNVPTDGFGNPVPNIGNDNFSAVFTSVVTFTPGLYEFIISADDSFRFYINGILIIDEDASGDGVVTSTQILNLNGTVTLIVEYRETTGNALMSVNWLASPGTPLPTVTPVPLAQAEVVTVRGLAVRTGPFLGASLIAVARPGITYDLVARNDQEGIFTWYKIRFDDDTIGWSSGRYLQITGFPELLPLENSTIFDSVNQTPTFDVIGTTRSVMNFRQRPSERVVRVPETPQIPWGAQVEILARTVQGGRDFWYQVQYCRPDGACFFGWILAAFVEVDRGIAPIDAIPIY